MESVAVEKIQVGDRGRKEFRAIPELAESINRLGQIEPIILTRDFKLIAGERRLRAVQMLGWRDIYADFKDELDPIRLKELELEENIQREDLTWSERCMMIAEIDRLKRQLHGEHQPGVRLVTPGNHVLLGDPSTPCPANELGPNLGWDQTDTALAVGISRPTVSKAIAMAAILEAIPELREEPDAKTALKKLDRLIREAEAELGVREFLREAQANPTGVVAPEPRLGDAIAILGTRSDSSIDCVIMDPPYGINLDSANAGRYQATGAVHFGDSIRGALDTFERLLPELRRVLKADGHLYTFCPIKYLGEFMGLLSKSGFEPDPIPLIWIKGTDMLVDYTHRFSGGWEPIIFCPSTRPLSRKRSSVFDFPAVASGQKMNVAEKPVALLRELIEMSTIEGQVVYDPFAGSGSTLTAAVQSKRYGQGSEQDPNQWNGAILRVRSEFLAHLPTEPEVEEEIVE